MSTPFNPHQGLIVIQARVMVPRARATATLALDLGATRTVINLKVLMAAGYDPALAVSHGRITTASGIVSAPLMLLAGLSTLGHYRAGFPVLAHTVPASVGIDGVLGLDFFRRLTLTIDFRIGQITFV